MWIPTLLCMDSVRGLKNAPCILVQSQGRLHIVCKHEKEMSHLAFIDADSQVRVSYQCGACMIMERAMKHLANQPAHFHCYYKLKSSLGKSCCTIQDRLLVWLFRVFGLTEYL